MEAVTREELEAIRNHMSNLPSVGAMYAPALVEQAISLLHQRDDLQAKLDAELPAAWREDVESLNGCLERASRDLYEARSEIDHHKRVALMLEAKCEEATRERDEAQGKVERIRRDFVQLQERVEAAGSLISQVGCDCPCDHDAESHDEHCERCIQCLLCGILWPRVSK